MPLHRQQADDARDIGDEAHVQHAVRFVEDERLHLSEIETFLLDQIEQAARGGDQHLDPEADLLDLRFDVNAAVRTQAADGDVFAVALDRFVNLDGQFAGRRQHQHAYRMARRRRAGAGEGEDALQQRQGKSGGLSGSGLGAAHQVFAGENDRNGLRLDRCRGGVTLIGNGLQQLGREAEFIKMHRKSL